MTADLRTLRDGLRWFAGVLSQDSEQHLQGMQQSHAVDQPDLRAARVAGCEQSAVLSMDEAPNSISARASRSAASKLP
ncbi:MAG TPA: hypothetical protein VFE41_10275 [Acetobacteraceae bacterium]|nr:hypothetical protein [Acetobacteraceae bacterium]